MKWLSTLHSLKLTVKKHKKLMKRKAFNQIKLISILRLQKYKETENKFFMRVERLQKVKTPANKNKLWTSKINLRENLENQVFALTHLQKRKKAKIQAILWKWTTVSPQDWA